MCMIRPWEPSGRSSSSARARRGWRRRGAEASRLHPIVLEERDRVGGQLLTVKRDGYLMEAAARICHESVMQLVREVSLRISSCPRAT